jgi:predicted MFS family arabinose efflux permease
VYTDRLDRKRILLVTQTFMLVDAAALATLAWTHHATLTVVLLLTFAQGLAIAFNGPTWMAYVPSLVPPAALVNAIALNSAQFSLARVIGPAIGAAIVAASPRGAAVVFAINALSYLAVIVSLVLIRARSVAATRRSVRELLAGGIAYTWEHRRIRSMIVAIAVVSFFGAPVTALLPIYAARVYGHGAGAFGTLAAAMGAGSVVGALGVGRLGNRVSPVVTAASLAFVGAVLIAFAGIPVYGAGLGLMVLYGAGYLMAVAGTNGQIQLEVDEAMRGRVLSIYLLAFGLFFPLGSLVAGTVAQAAGAPVTTAVGGIVCILWGVWMYLRFRGPASRSVVAMEPQT